MLGLLLLSYPSIESFMISCFENDMPNKRIDKIKKYVIMNRYNTDKIDETKLNNVVKKFLTRYKIIVNKDFKINDIDLNMKEINKSILDYEEK